MVVCIINGIIYVFKYKRLKRTKTSLTNSQPLLTPTFIKKSNINVGQEHSNSTNEKCQRNAPPQTLPLPLGIALSSQRHSL